MAIRNVRRDVMHDLRELKEGGDLGADDEHRAEADLQKVTDSQRHRARRSAEGQGRRDPRGLTWGRALRQIRAPTALVTSRSSPTATAAGPSSVGFRRSAGMRQAPTSSRQRLRDAVTFGIRELTVYSFSTENWNRSKTEVSGLMRMFARRIDAETPELKAEGVRMRFIGRREAPVSKRLIAKMEWAEAETAATTGSPCSSRSTTVVARRSSTPHARSPAMTKRSFAVTCTRPTCTTPI